MKIVLYQIYNKVGDLDNNVNKIINFYQRHKLADLIITPELALTGYGVGDDLYSKDFHKKVAASIKQVVQTTVDCEATLILGTPYFELDIYDNTKIYNVALVIKNGKITNVIYKNRLPNYGIFNEHRYFSIKECSNIIIVNNVKIGLLVCEDMWYPETVQKVVEQSPEFLISINASPYELHKNNMRMEVIKKVNEISNNILNKDMPVIYLNIVGGIDEVFFDGASFVLNKYEENLFDNKIVENHQSENISDKTNGLLNDNLQIANDKIFLELFFEDSKTLLWQDNKLVLANEVSVKNKIPELWIASREAKMYSCLVQAMQDFIYNCGFSGVILGLSGGIDSALTTTLAVDALGGENVKVVSMPSKYTSSLSYQIIEQIVKNLKLDFHEIKIDNLIESYESSLNNFINFENNAVFENLQARVRANILLSFTNQYSDYMLLTTGNKSEIATGYSTMYGDSCGGFNIIKDLYKGDVRALARWRNAKTMLNFKNQNLNVLPMEVIDRKPSAELRNDQFDEDSLMDYETLDAILFAIIEENQEIVQLYEKFDPQLVNKVIKLIKNSHYKRNQSAVGVKLSTRAFGKDFQYPLSGFFKMQDIS